MLDVEFHVIVTLSPDAVTLKCVLTYVKYLYLQIIRLVYLISILRTCLCGSQKNVCKIHRSVVSVGSRIRLRILPKHV